jgi:hypothetical protein
LLQQCLSLLEQCPKPSSVAVAAVTSPAFALLQRCLTGLCAQLEQEPEDAGVTIRLILKDRSLSEQAVSEYDQSAKWKPGLKNLTAVHAWLLRDSPGQAS